MQSPAKNSSSCNELLPVPVICLLPTHKYVEFRPSGDDFGGMAESDIHGQIGHLNVGRKWLIVIG